MGHLKALILAVFSEHRMFEMPWAKLYSSEMEQVKAVVTSRMLQVNIGAATTKANDGMDY